MFHFRHKDKDCRRSDDLGAKATIRARAARRRHSLLARPGEAASLPAEHQPKECDRQ
jgi:hypothetical protein